MTISSNQTSSLSLFPRLGDLNANRSNHHRDITKWYQARRKKNNNTATSSQMEQHQNYRLRTVLVKTYAAGVAKSSAWVSMLLKYIQTNIKLFGSPKWALIKCPIDLTISNSTLHAIETHKVLQNQPKSLTLIMVQLFLHIKEKQKRIPTKTVSR